MRYYVCTLYVCYATCTCTHVCVQSSTGVDQCIANVFSADNATVADLIGLTFWKYIEERRGPPVFVRFTSQTGTRTCVPSK